MQTTIFPFNVALKNYYQTKKDNKNIDEKGLLVFLDNSWKVVKAPTDEILKETLIKILSLDLVNISTKEHLIYWTENFNSATALKLLKNKKIKAIETHVKNVQFNSMNQYGWLSNFFSTLIYDSKYNMLYPSVENGYVAFKARKASKTNKEIVRFVQILNPKEVKQQGHDLWMRQTVKDEKEVLEEMERLVSLKFQQNPFIANLLKKSTASLEEFTKDSFWGSAYGKFLTENSNHLGRILEKTRDLIKK